MGMGFCASLSFSLPLPPAMSWLWPTPVCGANVGSEELALPHLTLTLSYPPCSFPSYGNNMAFALAALAFAALDCCFGSTAAGPAPAYGDESSVQSS